MGDLSKWVEKWLQPNVRQLHCNHGWYSGLYTLATRCHICTAVTLKYTTASSLITPIIFGQAPLEIISFTTVKSFDDNIAVSSNLILNTKNSND